jgi:leader peptidase (prepilin peptidase)/N-methyltransferase
MFIYALGMASFSTSVLYRFGSGEITNSGMKPYCKHCGYNLKTKDIIPFFSYFFLGGKCRSCRTPIGKTFMLLETSVMLTILVCFYFYGLTDQFMLIHIALMTLILAAFIFVVHKKIFNLGFYVIGSLGLIYNFLGEDKISLNNLAYKVAFAILILIYVEKLVKKFFPKYDTHIIIVLGALAAIWF